MEHIFLVGAVACLAVSWIYLLLLKAKIRDCMRYIEDRIEKANSGRESVSRSLEQGHESRLTDDPSRLRFQSNTFSALGRARPDEKPKLIVGDSGSLQPFHCLCSHCLRTFYLVGDQPAKEAVAELRRAFAEHVEQEHPSAAPASTKSSKEC